jgi:hypothetical protein
LFPFVCLWVAVHRFFREIPARKQYRTSGYRTVMTRGKIGVIGRKII